ncbi:MAG: hypothetical protein CM15mP49_13550 [Actinomycetota bacterium]|nr:MAG: hypothetical protein CM15mP49_13550 [Actinomycetota bacterium]
MKLSRKVTVTIAVGIGLMLNSVEVASASPLHRLERYKRDKTRT